MLNLDAEDRRVIAVWGVRLLAVAVLLLLVIVAAGAGGLAVALFERARAL